MWLPSCRSPPHSQHRSRHERVDAYRLDHLERLSDDRGLFEHADHLLRREEYGYCTDDNARLLLVTSREPDTGVADVLLTDQDHQPARSLLVDTLTTIGPTPAGKWAWPEPRLAYAIAALAEAVIAAGHALDRGDELDRGLEMLEWLLDLETRRGHLSVVGVGGRGPDDSGPMYDQQPIEVAAMADACWRAADVTGDCSWMRGVAAASRWFAGTNDTGMTMFDERSGGAFDGLQRDGVNRNQGAESTLAFISTMQRARSLVLTP